MSRLNMNEYNFSEIEITQQEQYLGSQPSQEAFIDNDPKFLLQKRKMFLEKCFGLAKANNSKFEESDSENS